MIIFVCYNTLFCAGNTTGQTPAPVETYQELTGETNISQFPVVLMEGLLRTLWSFIADLAQTNSLPPRKPALIYLFFCRHLFTQSLSFLGNQFSINLVIIQGFHLDVNYRHLKHAPFGYKIQTFDLLLCN